MFDRAGEVISISSGDSPLTIIIAAAILIVGTLLVIGNLSEKR